VPQCIKALADADIRLWVLTGDKMVRGATCPGSGRLGPGLGACQVVRGPGELSAARSGRRALKPVSVGPAGDCHQHRVRVQRDHRRDDAIPDDRPQRGAGPAGAPGPRRGGHAPGGAARGERPAAGERGVGRVAREAAPGTPAAPRLAGPGPAPPAQPLPSAHLEPMPPPSAPRPANSSTPAAQAARVLEEDAESGLGLRYALVIDGKALLYALSPMLRSLFLEVRGGGRGCRRNGGAGVRCWRLSTARTPRRARRCPVHNLWPGPARCPHLHTPPCRSASSAPPSCAAACRRCRRRRSRRSSSRAAT
jgi:hypothetical protein